MAQDKPTITALMGLAAVSLLATIAYYIYGLTPKISAIIAASVIVPLLLFAARRKRGDFCVRAFWRGGFPAFLPLILDACLLLVLFFHRTGGLSIGSPWAALPAWFFLLYAAATAALIWAVPKTRAVSAAGLAVTAHMFVTYSVAAIIFRLGFGFDGFIHRATETYIAQNGFILPKQPFYIGQYGLVVWLYHLTRIPIFYIDIFLVPVLASIFIPQVVSYALYSAWNIPRRHGLLLSLITPFVFFLSLNLTTPHNLAILLLIIIVFISVAAQSEPKLGIPLVIIALWASAAHPLLGIPALLFAGATLIIHKKKSKRFAAAGYIFYGIVAALAAPALFTAHLWLSGHPLPQFDNPFLRLSHFTALFKRPYWFARYAPLRFELLYGFQAIVYPMLALVGAAGLFIKKRASTIYCIAFSAFWISAYLLRSWIVFPDVLPVEQGDYPLRLVKAAVIFLLPFAMYVVYRFIYFAKSRLHGKQTIASAIIGTAAASAALMLTLYLSYPQYNQKVYFPGYNVTEADFEAARLIRDRHDDYEYIVLSNPITAAAALAEYGFAKSFETAQGELFYYSIPSGGRLFAVYEDMLYRGQKREYMEEAMRLAQTDTAYFVVSGFWSNYNRIIENAKPTADDWWIVDAEGSAGGPIFVAEY